MLEIYRDLLWANEMAKMICKCKGSKIFWYLKHWKIDVTSRLTHWGRVTHICVGKLTIIVSDNGLSPARRQAIIKTNAGILLIWPWWTNFSEILIEINTFSFKKMRLKVSSAKWRPFCLGLNVLSKWRATVRPNLPSTKENRNKHWPTDLHTCTMLIYIITIFDAQ